MIYLVRCTDYVEHPNEPNPISQQEIAAYDFSEARVWFARWSEEYQRPDIGRFVSIARLDDGIVVDQVDQPPCDDENAQDPDAEE